MPWLVNRKTGERRWVDDPQPQAIPVGPQNPEMPFKAPQAGAELDHTRTTTAGQQIDNQFDSATLPDRVRKAKADADKAAADAAAAQRVLSAPTDDQRKANSTNATMESIVDQINRVQDLYSQDVAPERMTNLWGMLDNVGPAAGRFNSAGQGLADQGLAAFRVPGQGSQSDYEAKQFAQANTPQAGDWDTSIEEKLANARRRVDANRKQMGLPAAHWNGVGGERDDPLAAAAALGGASGSAGGPTPPPFSPGDPRYQAATGDGRWVDDGKAASMLDQMVRAGASLDQLNAFGATRGMSPVSPQEYDAVRQYLQKNPGYKGSLVNARKYEPLSEFEKGITAVGDNAAGAYAIGAGNFLSGNTLDNLAPDPARARQAAAISKARNPIATAAGEISGGVMAGLSGEALLGRLGMAPRLARGVIADASAGAANGAGQADNGSRTMGAIKGAVASGLGSGMGSLVARGAARALTPNGGRLAPLYEAGVRPTPGQRFADSGMLGRALNATEEALQSVPLVGAAIRGARQESRDQFQIGAFNQALKEVGEALPASMRPGTDPHRYTQEVFNKVYENARSGMRVVADEKLANDLSGLAPDIETLGPSATSKLKAILRNSVDNRTTGSEMSGDAYKQSMSDLGKQISRYRKSPMGEDQNLADVLEGVQGALDSAARRHSNPDAVALLDAADAGYAKLVRIEEAAARRGGDQGTFSPTQFDSAVQRTSGGVRSKAYLRGDAAMQDYAKAGKSLENRLSDSGTAERGRVGYAATGGLGAGTAAGVVNPTVLGGLGALGLAYAPRIRKATAGMLAPSLKNRKAIAEQLKKRARLIGSTTAASGAPLLPGTIPSR